MWRVGGAAEARTQKLDGFVSRCIQQAESTANWGPAGLPTTTLLHVCIRNEQKNWMQSLLVCR